MTLECIQKAGITMGDLVEMFDLPIDRALPDDQIAAAMKVMGYDPRKLTPHHFKEASVQNKIAVYRRHRQAVSQVELKRYLDGYEGDKGSALASAITNDVNEISMTVGAEKKMLSLINLTHAKIADFMSYMAPTKFSQMRGIFTGKAVNPAQRKMMEDVVDEIFGQSTKNADAARFSKELTQALDDLNNRYNNASGDFRRLKDWGLPQRHDVAKIQRASFDEWYGYTADRLDRKAMVKQYPDLEDDAAWREALNSVYETLRTDGLRKIDDRAIMPDGEGGVIANRVSPRTLKDIRLKHESKRFLKFKDGRSWLDYQDKYGSGSIYQTITDHIMSTARETALMERFGPNHQQGFDYARAVVQKATGSKTSTALPHAYYEALSGINPAEPTGTAKLLKSIRDWNVATKLGGAVLSAQTDHAFSAQTALYNGLSTTRMMKNYIQQLSRGNQKEAAKVALTGEFALDRLSAAFEHNQAMNAGRSKALADTVMRITGMEAHTVAMRQAFGIEFLQALGDQSSKAFPDMPPKLQAAMKRYGIDEAKWDKIRSSEKTNLKGTDILDPTKIDDPDTQAALVGMILTETDFAVPTPGVRERATTALGSQAGTIHGEAIRNLTQFTSFPVTVMIKHMMGRGAKNRTMSAGSKIAYAAQLAITSTLLGALVYQAKQVAAGKTPMDWDDPNFWMRAADQGGYFGLLGGFFLDTEGYYSGYSGGPIIDGPVKDLAYTLVAGNIQKIKDGTETTFGKDATDFLIKNFPGNNIWYTRLATERAIFDQLRRMSNPGYDRDMNDRIRKLRRRTGQEYWWKPGELQPN